MSLIDEGTDRRCWMCKRHRTTGFVLVQPLDCCGLVVSLCHERCLGVITNCSYMTPEQYAAKWIKIHKLVCDGAKAKKAP